MDKKLPVRLDHPDIRGRQRAARSVYTRTYISGRGVAGDIIAPKRQHNHSETPKSSPKEVTQSAPSTTKSRSDKSLALKTKVPTLPRQSRSQVLKRQMVKTSSKKYRPKKARIRLRPILNGAFVTVLVIASSLFIFLTIRDNRLINARNELAVKGANDQTSLPSENGPPPRLQDYQVAADMPRMLRIPKLELEARIVRAEASSNNSVRAPASIFDVGWYEGSAKPGESGTILLNGHVTGPTKNGVFYGVSTLSKGDKISLQRGDGTVFSYRVVEKEIIEASIVNTSELLVSRDANKPGLNLISAGGRFNVTTNKYENRIVVYAVQE